MSNLKITALVGVLALSLVSTNAEAAKIKKGTVSTETTCSIHYTQDDPIRPCVPQTKQIVAAKNTNNHIFENQAEWPQAYESRLHTTASRFIGLHERHNRARIAAVAQVNPTRTPWCAAFVNGVLELAGYGRTNSNKAISFARYGNSTSSPRKGDIVVFRGHVGFYEGTTYRNGRQYVAVLGGNQSNRVQVSYFPASKVIAYRRAT